MDPREGHEECYPGLAARWQASHPQRLAELELALELRMPLLSSQTVRSYPSVGQVLVGGHLASAHQ